MNEPKKKPYPPERKRSEIVQITMTPSQRKSVRDGSKKAGKTMGSYIYNFLIKMGFFK